MTPSSTGNVVDQTIREDTKTPSIEPSRPGIQNAKEFLRGAGESILIGAIISVLPSIPGLGAVAVPAYAAYNYSNLGIGAYKLYSDWQKGKEGRAAQIKQLSSNVVDVALSDSEDRVADFIVAKLCESGAIDEVSRQTNINSSVYAEMLKGSISSAMSSGVQQLAKFAIGTAVGA